MKYVKARYIKNGFETKYKEDVAKILERKGEIEILGEATPPTIKKVTERKSIYKK